MTDWQDILTAPFSTQVLLELEDGRQLLATLEPGASLDENEQSCDQWWAVDEDEAPECWTDGACWTSNADEVMSLQPVKWSLPPAPVLESE